MDVPDQPGHCPAGHGGRPQAGQSTAAAPLPAATADDPGMEPEVTIVQKDDATVTEYRVGGRLYMIKVTPRVGPEYYLSDDDGTGKMVRRDGQPVLRPPMWVIKRF
ncbi:DUF2782 domain-containing protein [Chitinimonas arctica]|uniref:DUF2782 domain-containing protein n=1 Tax=Chitinimonas arctica TaxID=2594795 RepID=UPI001CC499D1|nr:DUF2782 domain-containing protein [Chitinimonas arctica]